jgi:hypothetical protein
MFHTFSDQTKAKRMMNFNKFIKIALQIYPMPLCLEDFLDIIDRCGRSYSHSTLSQHPTNNGKALPYTTYTSPSSKHDHPQHKNTHAHFSTESCASEHESSEGDGTSESQKNAAVSDILNHKDENRKMTSVLYTTFTITTLVYIVFIYFGIIDIEGCNFGKK